METTQKPLTFGQKLVGITFNPSNDENVTKVEQLFAEIADIVNNFSNSSGNSQLNAMLAEHSLVKILDAQMLIVKVLTNK